MSEEDVQIGRAVRLPATVSSKARRRSLDEWILVWFPVLYRILALAWSRLPPRSRLRRMLTAYSLRRGYNAANRRDFDVLVLGLDPEIELQFEGSAATGLIPPDLLGVHRGHEGYVHFWEAVIEASEDMRLEPEEAIDLGDRLLVVGRMVGHGTSSGTPIDEPLFHLFSLRRGLVIRETSLGDREKALQAAGLRE
jgi:ketosteroid isomerase-like protein